MWAGVSAFGPVSPPLPGVDRNGLLCHPASFGFCLIVLSAAASQVTASLGAAGHHSALGPPPPQAPHSLWRTYIGHRLCHTGPGAASWRRLALARPRAVAAHRPGTHPPPPGTRP